MCRVRTRENTCRNERAEYPVKRQDVTNAAWRFFFALALVLGLRDTALADDPAAAALLAKHYAYVGWQYGDNRVPTMKISEHTVRVEETVRSGDDTSRSNSSKGSSTAIRSFRARRRTQAIPALPVTSFGVPTITVSPFPSVATASSIASRDKSYFIKRRRRYPRRFARTTRSTARPYRSFAKSSRMRIPSISTSIRRAEHIDESCSIRAVRERRSTFRAISIGDKKRAIGTWH